MIYTAIAKIFSLFALAFLNSDTSLPEVVWQAQFGNSGYHEMAPFVDISSDNKIIIACSSTNHNNINVNIQSDIAIYILDYNGRLIMTKVIVRPVRQYPRAIACTVDGGFILALNNGQPTTRNIMLIKMNSEGSIEWEEEYGSSNDDEVNSILQTSDGGYMVCGSSESFTTNSDVYIFKADASGNLLWEETYGNSANQQGYAIIEDGNGDFLITGIADSFEGCYAHSDVLLLNITSSGDSLWTKNFGGDESDMGRCIIQTQDGGFLIVGKSSSCNSSGEDAYVLKLDANANVVWENRFGGGPSEWLFSCAEIQCGEYMLIGYSEGHSEYDETKGLLAMVDSRGNLTWSIPLGKDTYWGAQISIIDSNYFLISGTSTSTVPEFDRQIGIYAFTYKEPFSSILNLMNAHYCSI